MSAKSISRLLLFSYLRLASLLAVLLLFCGQTALCASTKENSKKDTVSKKAHSSKGNSPKKVGTKAEPKLDPVVLAIPPAEQLAKELELSPGDFKALVEAFSTAVVQGSRSRAHNLVCSKKEEACGLLASYFAQQDLQRRDRFLANRQKKIKPFKIKDHQIEDAQKMPFLTIVQRLILNKEADFAALANEAFRTTSCPRNLSAALAIRVEEYFPGTTARTLAKQLFEHAEQCMSAEDPAYERLHLRQGLYSLYDGNRERAERLLKKASQAKQGQERYRVLYWLGKISEQRGVPADKNQAWRELVKEFPLSFYSIVATTSMGQDPMLAVTNRQLGGIKRFSTNAEITQSVRWLEALYSQRKFGAVAKWASWIVKDAEEIEVDVLQYISTVKIASGLYRSNISMLFNYFKEHPAELNNEGLKLLYPRPYYDLVAEASRNKIDSFLVFGLMRQESAFDPGAISRAKAKGLMQIIPQTARTLASNGHRKLLNERDNTQMGVKYLVNLAQKFDGKMELVLASYNAGPMKVEEWLKRNPDRSDPLLWNDLMPFLETRDYVVSILRNNYFYIRLYGQNQTNLANDGKIYASEIVSQLMTGKK